MNRPPTHFTSETDLDAFMTDPNPLTLDALANLDSDLLILGAGGKMGPTLAGLAAKTLEKLASPYTVIGVSRFSKPDIRDKLATWGVETIRCDLLDRTALSQLPDSKNVIFMAGQKFGTSGNEALTWALNTYLPALVAERFAAARLVAFSTGNVYPLTPIAWGGSDENDLPDPMGEYANSCLGRERILTYVSQTRGLRCAIVRLNYAIDLRYGVLLDVATRVQTNQPVDLAMGAANVIWQGDANARALALLDHCTSPPLIINLTGPEVVSIRWLAQQFGRLLDREPVFNGQEAPTALLSNAAQANRLFGYPRVPLERMITWVADWVRRGGPTLDKPTHFETRDGRF